MVADEGFRMIGAITAFSIGANHPRGDTRRRWF